LLLQIVKFCEFDRRENEAANLFSCVNNDNGTNR